MAQKPPEEGYISVVDESEPELLELLRWEDPQNRKASESVQCSEQQVGHSAEQKAAPAKKEPVKPVDVDPFDLSDPDFIDVYRLSKDYFHKLCEELQPVMPNTHKVGTEVTLQNKLLSALCFFASGSHANRRPTTKNNTRISDPNLPMYLAHQAVLHVIQAFNHPSIVNKYIHFPHLASEREDIKARFYMKYGMPNVIGCVDCVHVPVHKPSDDDQKSHFNKSYHSKKVQIICDSNHTIMSVHPLGGGLTHDTVLSRHAVVKDLESLLNAGEHAMLLGSAYYSAKPYLMTPVPKITKKSAESPEKFFNALHAHTHSAVTVTVRQLKSRWKCLQSSHKFLDANMVNMMVVSCCVLHNMCNARGLPATPMAPAEERLEVMKQKVANGPITKRPPEGQQCQEIRKQLIERVWSERRVVPNAAPAQEPAAAKKPKKRISKKERLLQGYQASLPDTLQQQVCEKYQMIAHHSQQQQQQSAAAVQQAVQHIPQDEASKRARMELAPAPAPPVYITHGMWNHYQPHPHPHTTHHAVVDVNTHRYGNKQ